uniref:COP9 signalosome complex subunit 6 n=1 Tax=Felis catus TaxID=9685 RepID=A0ABI7YDS5_FELCA
MMTNGHYSQFYRNKRGYEATIKQLYDNKWDHLDEMGKFLEIYNLSRLNHEELENLNRPGPRLEGAGKMAAAANRTGGNSRDGGGCSSSPQRDGLRRDRERLSPLHPLVILNISDHWIRMRSREGRPMQVIGALIGKQEGRNIEFKQVFKELELLGWYTPGGPPDPSDIHLQKQACEIIQSPLFLKLNPMTRHTHLPNSVFESVIDIINAEATMLFAELTYTLATEEAERIGVNHVAGMIATGRGENSTVAEHLIEQHSAIKMLHSRVKLIWEYVKASEAGEVPFNQEILRRPMLCVTASQCSAQTSSRQTFTINVMTWGSWPTLAPSAKRATP